MQQIAFLLFSAPFLRYALACGLGVVKLLDVNLFMEFIGRKKELELLQHQMRHKNAAFVVVRGRRRIGKSRLIEEFAKGSTFYSLSGIVPTDKTTAQLQRDEFAGQLAKHGCPWVKAQDWSDLFWMLAERTKRGRVIILLDEISWMGSKDPEFLSKLKNAWDEHFKKNARLMLILCGSASSWIEKNILSQTGFVGRISQTLTLRELPLHECNNFWGAQSVNISALEKFKLLSVTGGVPRYLEEIDPNCSAEENLRRMCFTDGALLVNEFDHIFSSMFLRNSDIYRKLIVLLVSGAKEFTALCSGLDTNLSGRILEYLLELELAGFVQRDYTWSLETGHDGKLSKFRLSDNYLRFYLRHIEKNKTKILRGAFDMKSLALLAGWDTIMGLQFENLVLSSRSFLWTRLGVQVNEIVSENPFFQRKTQKQAGCQIDYLIQTRFGCLYVCEVKLSRHPLGVKVIEEVKQKIKSLRRPKAMSVRPVLVHVGGVEDAVIESGYFSHIINFADAFCVD